MTEDRNWKVKTDKAYSMLTRALRAKAEEIAKRSDNAFVHEDDPPLACPRVCYAPEEEVEEDDSFCVENIVIVPDEGNAAWAIVRVSKGAGLFLLRGEHTIGPDLAELAGKAGAGIQIQHVRWEPSLLKPMRWLSDLEEMDRSLCNCGHVISVRVMHNNERGCSATIPYCEGCGWVGANPESWSDIEKGGEA